jgi:CopG family nickel-responsive transcriptional regulator
VQSFANRVIAERGVRHGHVVYVPAPNGKAHRHSHEHGHDHGQNHDNGHDHAPKRARRRKV